MRSTAVLLVLALGAAGCTRAHPSTAVAGSAAASPGGMAAIREADLRRDLFAMSNDSMRGREAGTLDELRASAWLADRVREAGLEPAGDDGTYFQFWPMRRQRVAATSHIELAAGGAPAPLTMGTEWVAVTRVNATLDLPLVWAGESDSAALGAMDLRGKAVAAMVLPPTPLPPSWVSLRAFRYAAASVNQRAALLRRLGAAAIVLVSNAEADEGWNFYGTNLVRGSYGLDTANAGEVATGIPVLWVRSALLDRVRTARRLTGELRVESFVYPSVNVVAKVPGRDPALRGEYVLYSGHQDHDGVRFAVDGDSIWNGADDNASVSVAMLAIGRAVARAPGRRSSLFVWHGAEERGLLGSRWFVAHPMVPRDSIVAVLNGDMIGRNSPDSAALLGVTAPHRNSSDLVATALAANARTGRFILDSTWDRPTHAEGWYFRSDHLPYARAGIPSLMFTTLLHPDYHTPRDEPQRIDVAKLARMTQWIYATGAAVADAEQRPRVDAGFRLER